MKKLGKQFVAMLMVVAFILGVSGQILAATSPDLGTAGGFAVLGGSTVTNTGASVINGNLGLSPGSAVVGFPPGIVTSGTIHAADAVASQAQTDLTTAYNNAAGQACDTDLTSQDLGGLTLTPGVYCFSTSAQLTGTLTLNAQGNPDAVFIFKIGSTLTTASNSRVNVINSGQACNVFWQIGSSATLGTTTSFSGTLMALSSITLTTGSTLNGRALARSGATTLDTNTITFATCATTNPSDESDETDGSGVIATNGNGSSATVVPKFPNTGISPTVNNNKLWVILPTGIIIVTFLYYFARKKQLI